MSLEDAVGPGAEQRWRDVLADLSATPPLATLLASEDAALVASRVHALPPLWRAVLVRRFGLDGEPAMTLVLERLPATVELAGAGLLIAICLAIPTGIVSAVPRNKLIDYVATVFALLGQAMPTFWLGIMLILVFSVQFGWLPSRNMKFHTMLLRAWKKQPMLRDDGWRCIRSTNPTRS